MRRILTIATVLFVTVSAEACIHCAYSAAVQGAQAIAGVWLPTAPDSVFMKAKSATSKLEMKNAQFVYDTNEWSVLTDSLPNESFDGQFQHVDGNIRGMAMSVKEFQPADEFLESFVGGMAESYPGTVLLSKRSVVVNGENMLEVQVDMPVDGATVRYYGFLHAGSRGIAMVLSACHAMLFDEVSSVVKSFTAGLIIARPKNQIKIKRK
jgi:hypothetical protein